MISKFNIDTDGILTFHTKKLDISILNTIRRVILTDIPSWCFSDFKILINKSPFMDEYITDRLGLIPIYTNVAEKASEDLKFNITVEGVINDIKNIYSKDIKSSDGKKYFPENSLITKLKGIPDRIEKLSIEMKLSKGTSLENVKWSVVNVAVFIPINNSEEYLFKIEPNEKQDAKKTLLMSIDIIIEKLENIRKIGSEKVKITELKPDFYEIILMNENHTMGNLIKRYIDLHKPAIECGYNKIHPLQEKIIMKITTSNPKKIITETCTELIKIFAEIRQLISQ